MIVDRPPVEAVILEACFSHYGLQKTHRSFHRWVWPCVAVGRGILWEHVVSISRGWMRESKQKASIRETHPRFRRRSYSVRRNQKRSFPNSQAECMTRQRRQFITQVTTRSTISMQQRKKETGVWLIRLGCSWAISITTQRQFLVRSRQGILIHVYDTEQAMLIRIRTHSGSQH